MVEQTEQVKNRLNKRMFSTNILLSEMKMKKNSKCSYCTNTVDSMEHFFAECPLVSEFWKFIEGFILCGFGIMIELYFTDILFGVQWSNTHTQNLIRK